MHIEELPRDGHCVPTLAASATSERAAGTVGPAEDDSQGFAIFAKRMWSVATDVSEFVLLASTGAGEMTCATTDSTGILVLARNSLR